MIFSVTLNLPNASLHKQTLKSSDFYNKLSTELQASKLNKDSIKDGFGSLVLISIFTDLASPGWLQNLFERNIDDVTSWLNGDSPELKLYIPTKEVELAVSNKIDSQTKDLSDKLGSDITTCTKEQADTIKRQGFDVNKDFCLPESVKSGQQTLTQFMGLTGSNVENNNFLNKLLSDNSLNPSKNNFNVNDLNFIKNKDNGTLKILNQVRDGFIFTKKIAPVLLGISLFLILAEIFLSTIIKKRFVSQLRRFSFNTSTGTLSLAATIVIIFGLFSYFTSYIQNLFLPGIGTGQLTTLISLEIVKLTFNLVSTAVWISLGLLGFSLILWALEKTGIFDRSASKNKNLSQKQPSPQPTSPNTVSESSTTMDEEFHAIREQKVVDNHQNDDLIKSFEEAENDRLISNNSEFQNPIPKPENITPTQKIAEARLAEIRARLYDLNHQTPPTSAPPSSISQDKPEAPKISL